MKYIFIGLESFTWKIADFQIACQNIKACGYDTVVFKVGDGPNQWYDDGTLLIYYKLIQSTGLHPIPYVFNYGNTQGSSVQDEFGVASHILSLFGEICLDMEGGFNGKPDDAVALVSNLRGKVHVSTWANIVDQDWSLNIARIWPLVTSIWPQVYTQYDSAVWAKQYTTASSSVWSKIFPTWAPETFCEITEDAGFWEYSRMLSIMASYPVNSHGEVMQTPTTTEFQPKHSEFTCGAFAVAVCKWSSENGQPFNPNYTDLISWAESEYAKTAGDNGPGNTVGASVDDMHTYLRDTGTLHYWDITAINSNSAQANDIAEIKAALQHGYPVIGTVIQSSPFDLELGRNPYWFGTNGNHILVYVGIASDGNLLVVDTANVYEGDGNLQTHKDPLPQPRRYDASKLANQWATIVKMPWLPNIPNGEPLSWPPYQPPTPPENTNMEKIFRDTWRASFIPVRTDTGIYDVCLQAYLAHKITPCQPTSQEFNTVNSSGRVVIHQTFSNGVTCEWDGPNTALYDATGKRI